MSDIKSYITRGAILTCDCGTHCRRVNLRVDHGFGIDVADMEDEKKTHPFILSCDSYDEQKSAESGKRQNISWFGVCKGGVRGSDNVTLKPDTLLNENASKNEYGPKCCPQILGDWQNTKGNIEVISNNGTGNPIMSNSYLVCKYGGVISIMENSNGNEYDGSMDMPGPAFEAVK